jgi:hypothetical protein
MLPSFKYISLRFIAQASYETAAQLRISPAPDVVTRVFMLFRGIRSDDVGLWASAAARATAEDGATFWTKVVGVDATLMRRARPSRSIDEWETRR